METFYFTPRSLGMMRHQATKLHEEINEKESQLGDAASVGGDAWHDNFSFEQLTAQIRGLSKRLSDMNALLNKATLAPRPTGSVVAIGTRVKIAFNGDEEEWFIGGYGESDPENFIIAYNTPLASLILGKSPGETVKGLVGNREAEIKIISIQLEPVTT